MELVSIIIPVYNGDGIMKNAIESCINQTYTNIEIIIINDGSTDNSKNVAQEYAIKDERIVIYSQLNGGLANARNSGLKIAKGDYIQFLDCDDTLEKDAIEVMVNELKNFPNADLLLYGFNIYSVGKLLRKPNPGDGIYCLNEGYAKFKKIHYLMTSACNKLYKKRYITQMFRETCVFAEDTIFNYQNLKKNTIIKTLETSLYNVCLDTLGSVNKRYKEGKLFDFLYSKEVEELTLSNIFELEFDKRKYRTETLSTLGYVICNMAKNITAKSIEKEINSISETIYYKRLLKNLNSIKVHYKILFFLVKKRAYGLTRVYSSFILSLNQLFKKKA